MRASSAHVAVSAAIWLSIEAALSGWAAAMLSTFANPGGYLWRPQAASSSRASMVIIMVGACFMVQMY